MNEEFCLKHSDVDCEKCPYYEVVYEVNGNVFEGKFWAGQNYSVQQGFYGDGVFLRPRQFDYEVVVSE